MRRPVSHSVALLEHGDDVGVLHELALDDDRHQLVDGPAIRLLYIAQLGLDPFFDGRHGGLLLLDEASVIAPGRL